MQTDLSVEIDRPIEEVFERTNANVADWSIICVENERLEDKPDGVGSIFRIVTEDRGKRMEFQGVTTKYDPPNLSAVHMVGDQFDIDAEYRFEDLGSNRTRVTQDSKVTGKGFTKFMLFCCGWMMKKSSCKAQENELNSLKKFVESR